MNCYQEVSARNSPILLVTNDAHMGQCTIEHIMMVEKNEYYGFILGLLPLQLLSYYVTIKKGYNPDKPRNLAKVVTVE
jgi:glucosamine--fructose-6-phosphate aminotransferase (isomerizing)